MNQPSDTDTLIPLSEAQCSWKSSKPVYVSDGLYIKGWLAVSKAEALIQERIAQLATRHKPNSVCEIGFGLGLCSKAILKNFNGRHLIIEANSYLSYEAETQITNAIVINDFWENHVEEFLSSDSVIYDPCPITCEFDGSASASMAQLSPFLEALCDTSNKKPNCFSVFFCDQNEFASSFSSSEFSQNFEMSIYPMSQYIRCELYGAPGAFVLEFQKK